MAMTLFRLIAPAELPHGTRYWFHDFMGTAAVFEFVFRNASPHSELLGSDQSLATCITQAQLGGAVVVTADPSVLTDAPNAAVTVFFIPPPFQNISAYYNAVNSVFLKGWSPDSGSPNDFGRHTIPAEQLMGLLMGCRVVKVERPLSFLRRHHPYFHPQFLSDRIHTINLVYSRLSNQESKAAYATMSYANPLMAFDYFFQNIYSKTQYFDYLNIQPDDVILNCGVDNGWEIPFFCSVAAEIPKIYAFDPTGDSKLSDYARLFAERAKDKGRIEFLQFALSDRDGELYFDGYNVVPAPSNETDRLIPARSIDSFVTERQLERVDVIKMDLEGAEPLVVSGMMETVERFRPQLAIAVYHALEHAFDIPELLVNRLKGYNFYYDFYNLDLGEQVFYCIPQERDVRRGEPFVYNLNETPVPFALNT